jgi:hypothetical protein
MNDDAGLSISQFREAWRLLCGACPGYLTGDAADVNYIFSGLPIPFFNVALVTADNDSATDAGRPVYARMGYHTIAAHTAFIETRFLEGH